jgi:hypothetical protein
MKVRIELTDEVVKAITENCPLSDDDEEEEKCFARCALAGACLEYWTGNKIANPLRIKDKEQ